MIFAFLFCRICTNCKDPFLQTVKLNDDGVKICPNDECELDGHFPDNAVLKEIMLLECWCKRKVEGCRWSGPLVELGEHMRDCKNSGDAKEQCDDSSEPTEMEQLLNAIRAQQNHLLENADKLEDLIKGILSAMNQN